MVPASAAEVVRRTTHLAPVCFVPELVLHQAGSVVPLWERVEQDAGAVGTAPPYWAFPWVGGLALARFLLEHPGQVAGRDVLDVASGSGLVALAAARAGAAHVLAVDVDPRAVAAIGVNATANGVAVTALLTDVLDGEGGDADVVLAGDVFYERQMAERFLPFLQRAARRGALVLVGDPGRSYLPRDVLELVAAYEVPVTGDTEDAAVKRSAVWRLRHPS